MTNVLLVAIDPMLGERITSLSGHRVVSLNGSNAAEVASLASEAEFQPDIIFVGAGVSTEQAIEYARVIRPSWPNIAVILVAAPDKGLVRRATKAGIRGVIHDSISDNELVGLIERARTPVADGPDAHTMHQVIVVASPKGGVGKTTTVVNLAAVLAEAAPWELVVIDLDLQFGDVSAVLGVQPAYTVADAFAADDSDSMLVRTLLSVHPSGFYVLCGAEGPADTGSVTGDQIRKLISQLSASFRYVVIDTSAGLLEETLSSLEEATDLVFVTALDIATLRASRKELDVLTELGLVPRGQHVLLNKSDRRTGLTVRDAERMLGRRMDAIVPQSDTVALAANHGELAVTLKRSVIRRAFETLGAKVSFAANRNHREVNS